MLDEGVRLRIKGRLSKSPDIPREAKHPLLLSSKHPLTRLVVLFYHCQDCHCGLQYTLMSTRQKFWIANGNAAVRDMCVIAVCVLLKGRRLLNNSCLAYRWHALQYIKSLFLFRGGLPWRSNVCRGKKQQQGMGTPVYMHGIHVQLVTSCRWMILYLPLLDLQTCVDRSIRPIQIMQARSRTGQKSSLS